jgi:hypothetical protein
MGQEASCTVVYGNKTSAGKAYLESDQLLFRGDFRLAIPTKSVKAAEAKAGKLIVRFADGTATFSLGDRAEKWAHKLLNPKSLIDKLGVKAETSVAVIGISDPAFLKDLGKRAKVVYAGNGRSGVELVLFGITKRQDLSKLKTYKKLITKDGAIWAVFPKGDPTLSTVHVLESGRSAGLADNKVARFSDTHTAYRFVIPRADR